MKEYLGQLKSSMYRGVPPKQEVPIVIAALHPKMLELAARETSGTHPYFVPPETYRQSTRADRSGPLDSASNKR